MIRKACNNDLTCLKKMWHEIFGDDFDYISLFFDEVMNLDNCFVNEIDKQLSGMIYFVDYDFKSHEKVFKTSYICGIAVKPKFRGLGIMKDLLEHTLTHLATAMVDFAVLIPATDELYCTYERFGFQNSFCTYLTEKKKSDIQLASNISFKTGAIPYFIYKNAISKCDNILIFNKNNVAHNNKYITLLGGDGLYYDNGFCYYYIENSVLIVKECFVMLEDLPALLYYFKSNFKFETIKIYSYYNMGEKVFKGMAISINTLVMPDNSYMNMMLV